MDGKPVIALITTGGTIDSLGASRLDLVDYPDRGERLESGRLVGGIPELAELAEVREVAFRRLPSHALVSADWFELAAATTGLLDDPDVDGVVITHGTNTLEETAYFLHLTVRSPKPVVVVGAMRPASALSSDGELNLLRAVQVAASERAREQGTLVVLNDAIWSARDVTKGSTMRVQAFHAPDLGPLGYVDGDGRTSFYHRHTREHGAFDIAGLDALPRVDVIVSYVDADEVMIDAAVAAGARGLVVAGTGAGRPTPPQVDALARAAEQGVVICLGQRTGSGRVPSTGWQRSIGAVTTDNLQPWKAKVLLSLALTQTNDPAEIQSLFDSR
ncbi:asparaginase [Pseudonocardia acaciae]|uniref:asparaginase n=1 Tax=Pseudonocardia acaciae TaxID=551276 RepID=UPI00048E5BDB|nr:asparaginase [Pseudonocardia acaciae]